MTSTVGDVFDVAEGLTLPPGTVVARPPRRGTGARVRAKIPVTVREAKALAVVAADTRSWWLVAESPPSLGQWWKAARAAPVVPEDAPVLRAAYRVDTWSTGLLLAVLSALLLLLAGGLRWLACHPLRRWSAACLAASVVAVYLLARGGA